MAVFNSVGVHKNKSGKKFLIGIESKINIRYLIGKRNCQSCLFKSADKAVIRKTSRLRYFIFL